LPLLDLLIKYKLGAELISGWEWPSKRQASRLASQFRVVRVVARFAFFPFPNLPLLCFCALSLLAACTCAVYVMRPRKARGASSYEAAHTGHDGARAAGSGQRAAGRGQRANENNANDKNDDGRAGIRTPELVGAAQPATSHRPVASGYS
jgi:hypothetical protein